MPVQCVWPARAKAAVAAALAALLAGCGGGVYLGYDYIPDDPPSVDLVVSTDVAAPNEAVRLLAAASDDFAVDRVSFYRIDAGRSVLLVTDRSAPWQLDTLVPADAVGSVRYFARAVDDAGQSRDSVVVTVLVQ
jgi:hypothetical protein